MKILKLFLLGVLSFSLSICFNKDSLGIWPQLGIDLVNAQTLRPEVVANEVYIRFRDLPQENQYISVETGKIELDNSLISRLVRYHQYIKSRPTKFRLDWQLTLADYLGVNENIKDFQYPGNKTLTTNPLLGDINAINNLNRRQRDNLVNILVSIYNPPKQNSESSKPLPENNENKPKPPEPSLNLPKPGDAQLLIP